MCDFPRRRCHGLRQIGLCRFHRCFCHCIRSRLKIRQYISSRICYLFIALNPRIAEAVLGRRPHARIEMTEVRKLETDPARLMHQRLSGWIDPGKSGKAEINTLCDYVWPDVANDEAMKKRRQAARKALAELVAVGWVVSEYAKGKFEISRPKSRL